MNRLHDTPAKYNLEKDGGLTEIEMTAMFRTLSVAVVRWQEALDLFSMEPMALQSTVCCNSALGAWALGSHWSEASNG